MYTHPSEITKNVHTPKREREKKIISFLLREKKQGKENWRELAKEKIGEKKMKKKLKREKSVGKDGVIIAQ